MAEPSQKPIIDVELLVEGLKERVARERAAGAYANDLSGVELEVLPPQAMDLGEKHIRFRPELAFSSKPVIGPVITLVKKFFVRLLFFVLDDLARQTDAAVTRLEMALGRLEMAVGAEASARENTISAEVAAREAVQVDVKAISQRVDEIEDGIERLQLAPRLARLERARRSPAAAQVASPAGTASAPAGTAGWPFDYLAFEARFRPEESVRERQQAYVQDLRGATRVADLGCGRGELVELLNGAGIAAYGVEIEPDFIELMREKGLEVVEQDALEHLRGLENKELGGIVASHVVEHLSASAVTELVTLAAEKLGDGGTLILETPNPESLLAGSVNFHRDLTHVRPIHPDTLAFLAESAGFSEVEIRRLSAVPEEERLPSPGDPQFDGIVERLNDLLYGYQDYAVVAHK